MKNNAKRISKQNRSKFLNILSLGLIFALLLITLCSCFDGGSSKKGGGSSKPKTDEEKIEARINEFITAYNDGDMDAVLQCLDATTRNAFQALLNLMGGFVGSQAGFDIDLSDLFSLGVSTAEGDFMELEIRSIAMLDSSNAIATTFMDLNGAESTIYFIMVYEKGGWYIHDMTDTRPANLIDNSAQGAADVKISGISYIDDGVAYIKFISKGKSYYGLVNSAGEIFSYSENYYPSFNNIGGGAYYTVTKEGNKTSYQFYGPDCNPTATASSDDFDDIIGCGDGMILVHKNTSTISEEEHSYGVMDYSGNWIKPLVAGPYIPINANTTWSSFRYVGGGLFVSSAYYSYDMHYMIYNCTINQTFTLSECYLQSSNLTNGVLYFNTLSSWDGPSLSYYNDQKEPVYQNLPRYFAFSPDGSFEEISEFTESFGNLLINTNGDYRHQKAIHRCIHQVQYGFNHLCSF